MYVHHAPWCEHGFLVGVAEGGEDSCDTLNAFFPRQAVGSTSHSPDAFGRCCKYLGIVVALEFVEVLLRYAAWHELLPRLRVDERSEVVERDGHFLILDLSTVNHERHAYGYAAQNTDGVLAILLLGFKFF